MLLWLRQHILARQRPPDSDTADAREWRLPRHVQTSLLLTGFDSVSFLEFSR